MTSIEVSYEPVEYRVKLWWFDATKASHLPQGIAEWETIWTCQECGKQNNHWRYYCQDCALKVEREMDNWRDDMPF